MFYIKYFASPQKKSDNNMKKFEEFRMTTRITLMLVFSLCATAVYYLIWSSFYNSSFEHPFRTEGTLFLLTVYFIVLTVSGIFLGTSRIDELRKSEIIFYEVIALLFTNGIAYVQICLVEAVLANILGMVLILLAQTALVVIWAVLSSVLIHKVNPPEEMIIIYGSHLATEIVYKMSTMEDRYKILESVSIDEGLENIIKKTERYPSVIICDAPARLRNDILKYCYTNNKKIYVVPKISDIIIRSASDISYFDSPIMRCTSNGLTIEQRAVKRFFDILLSLIAIILLSPVFIIISLAIKAEDGGPVFYKQRRSTKDLVEFDILKFRSMIVNAEQNGPQPAVDNDKRITKTGKIIRKLRFDELPQVFNILKGDMSFVGPRPERVEHVKKYSEQIPEFVDRYKVKGGLTGYAQVFGKYNTSPYNKLKMDLMYIQNYSLSLDIKIFIMTIKILFKSESTEGFKNNGKNEK